MWWKPCASRLTTCRVGHNKALIVRPGDYLSLYQLAKKRLDSPEAYRAFQRFQGELLIRFLYRHELPVEGKCILDLGCGLGGYSHALTDRGAQVVGIDRFLYRPESGLTVLCADALHLPLASERFDMVICASLIEHVPAPVNLIREIQRVLRMGGIAYLSFPPFYSPVGGHQFSPFHLFGERIALWIARRRGLYRGQPWLQERYPEAPASFSRAFGAWGLYPLTIARVEKILHSFPLRVIEKSTRWLPVDFSGLPVLGEFLTWHVQFLLGKTGRPEPGP